ncbi:MAG: restriction endonuclease subunit S [Treponema sp.]|nr:restriction endonuclease subunit S [Treponema sp.]
MESNSKIDWIGTVPENWTILKLKYTFSNTIAGEVIDKTYWNDGEEILYTCQKTPMKSTFKAFPDYKRTGPRDILLTRNATPYIFIPKEKSIYSNVVQKITINSDYNLSYIRYALSSAVDSKIANGNTIPSWNMEIWSNLKLAIPQLKVQTKISTFLDKKDSEIDSVLTKTKESIEEYKWLKHAIITQAVTKGIRPNRKMKDSGNIWLGDVPSEWKIKRIKYIFRIKKDIAGKEGYTVLSITQKGIKPKDLSKNEGQIAENYSNYQLVNIGDFAMNHMDLLTGWVDVSKYEGVTSPDYRVFVFQKPKEYSKEYYLYFMQMCYTNKIFYGLGQGVSGMGRWRLQADKFLNFTVTVPALEEQKEIAAYLDKKCSEIDKLIEKKEQLITELETYKKSLIYEYVTGKKEVK